MAGAHTQGLNRTQVAEMVAREARVFVRRARRDGHSNTITRQALEEAAQTLNLVDGTDYSMRTVVRLVKADAKLMGETDLLDL